MTARAATDAATAFIASAIEAGDNSIGGWVCGVTMALAHPDVGAELLRLYECLVTAETLELWRARRDEMHGIIAAMRQNDVERARLEQRTDDAE